MKKMAGVVTDFIDHRRHLGRQMIIFLQIDRQIGLRSLTNGSHRLSISGCIDGKANNARPGSRQLVEIQGTAEGMPFTREQMNGMIDLAEKGIARLLLEQQRVLGLPS